MADFGTPASAGTDGNDELNFREMWYLLVRNRWIVLGTTAATILLAILITARQQPVYEAGVTLRIDEQDRGQNLLGDLSPIAGLGAKGKIETEMVVLRSRQVAEAVVDSLKLALHVVEPSGRRDDVLRVVSLPREVREGSFELRRTGDGAYGFASVEDRFSRELPASVRPGEPFRIGEALLLIPAGGGKPDRIRFVLRDFRDAVSAVRLQMRIFRPDPTAHVVGITFSSTDPQLAAAVPNAASTTFISYKSQTSKVESRSTVNFLREQVASYEGELQEAEERVRSFREAQQVVSLSDEASQQVRRLADLQAEMDRVQAERSSLAALLQEVTRNQESSTGSSPYRQLAAFPVFLQNRAVQDMLQSLTQLENELSRLMVRRTEQDADVAGVQARIGELETQLYQMARNYLGSLDNQILSLQDALSRFGEQLESIPSREVEFARLSREQQLIAEIFTLLQTRLKEAEIKEAVEPGDVRVIDPALVPERPVSPRPVRNLGLAGILGLFLGIAAAFARQGLDTRIRSKEDVSAATAGAPVLGMIPRIKASTVVGGNGNGRRSRITAVSPLDLVGERLVTRLDPGSPASEAYRALRTNITFANIERSPRVIVVTSAMPGDGKSTSASNLAITLAQQGTRVLLVDADLRRGVLNQIFGVPRDPGLTHVLLGRTTLSGAVQQVPAGSNGELLSFLATGMNPPNPAELLASAPMRTLLQAARSEFEMVIFDAPPLNLVTDAAILGTAADATILVARTGITDRRALHHAAAQIHHLGATLGGVVLNDIDLAGSRYAGYGYGYGYGYGQRYEAANGSGAS